MSPIDAHLGGLFKDQNSHSISALQPYRYDTDDYEANDTIGELLSPFSVNPDDYPWLL